MATVLVVEDDAAIGSVLDSALRGHGHTVRWCRDGRSALRETAADLVLLDLGLPDIDGVEVCRRLRSALPGRCWSSSPRGRTRWTSWSGWRPGPTTISPSPSGWPSCSPGCAHLRRGAPAAPSTPVVRIGALEVDIASRRVSLGGREVALRAREFDLLARLAVQPGQAVSRDTLMSDVWDAHWHGSTKTLDVHIAALRRKLAAAAESPYEVPRIATLRGHGYRLEGG